jgi:hypothetical protein
MTPTYQQKIIATHLQSTCGQRKNWPFASASEIEDELCKGRLSLSPGEYLVVALSDDGGRLGKVSDIQGLAHFPRTSLIISYHEIERAFHDIYAEWVEL